MPTLCTNSSTVASIPFHFTDKKNCALILGSQCKVYYYIILFFTYLQYGYLDGLDKYDFSKFSTKLITHIFNVSEILCIIIHVQLDWNKTLCTCMSDQMKLTLGIKDFSIPYLTVKQVLSLPHKSTCKLIMSDNYLFFQKYHAYVSHVQVNLIKIITGRVLVKIFKRR